MKCPHIITQKVDDESYDFCNLVDKPCLLISGCICDEWEEIKREWDEEASDERTDFEEVKK
jgi:hypothetical protein